MDSKRKIVELDINAILPNRFQPRISFDDAGLNELTESVKNHGVIQPIIVRKLGEKFEIIAGERRYKASILAGLKTIPAIITDFNDKQSSEIALIENVQRRDLTPIEEAISYKRILDMNYLTQDELAKKLGKTQSTIANKLRLLNLCDDVQEALLFGKISERHARSLLRVKDSEQQKLLLNRIINERLTVRRTDEEIDNMFRNNENQENNLNIPSSTIIGDDNTEVMNNPTSQSGVDMLYNQATMNIPKIMGEDIEKYEEEKANNQPILNQPVEELHFGFEENNNDTINPGFMDISNIESNAKDIFNERPARPFHFSEPDPVVETPAVEEVQQEPIEEKTPLINPMFIQAGEEAEEKKIEEETPVVENPAPAVNNGGFDFDFIPAETVKTNTVEIPALDELDKFGHFEEPKPVEEAVVAPVVPETPAVEEVQPAPVVEQPVETLSFEEPTPVETLSFEEPATVVEQPEVLSFDTPTVEPVVEEPQVAPQSVETLSFEEPTQAVEQPEVLNFETPVVEPIATPVEETPVVEEVQPEPVVEQPVEEKVEKRSFFDKLKSLVDPKQEKLEEPVVETSVELPAEEAVVTPVEEVQPAPVVEQPVETLSFEEPTPVETLSFEEPTQAVEQPEVLSFDTPTAEDVTSTNEEVLDFGGIDPNVEPVVETPVEEVNTEPIVNQDFNYTINDVPVAQHNMASPFATPVVNAESTVEESINSLEETANEMDAVVDAIDTTPVVYDEVEKVEEIPSDVLGALNDEPTTLEEIATSDLDKTIDMPADLAEIVSNPELTNNFVGNDDVPSVEETPVVSEISEPSFENNDNFAMPLETLLDNVEVPAEDKPEENAVESPVEETVVAPVVEEVQPEPVVETPSFEEPTPIADNSEMTEFVPESLPDEDDDETSDGEDLTVPLYQPIYEEPTPVTPVYDETPTVNIGAAMKVIREATQELQKLGFIVDTEELDFEDVYQVIFKINKNRK